MLGALIILQAGVAALPADLPSARGGDPLPTIELRARVRADSVRLEQQGDARLIIDAAPLLDARAEYKRNKPVPNGTTVRNVEVELYAAATLDPAAAPGAPAASPPPQTPSTDTPGETDR